MKALVPEMNKNERLRNTLTRIELNRSADYEGYGFELVIGKRSQLNPLVYPTFDVKPDSPAERAGLANGQRLIAVNRKFINDKLNRVDELIDEFESSYYREKRTSLLVLEQEHWTSFMQKPYSVPALIHKMVHPRYSTTSTSTASSTSSESDAEETPELPLKLASKIEPIDEKLKEIVENSHESTGIYLPTFPYPDYLIKKPEDLIGIHSFKSSK